MVDIWLTIVFEQLHQEYLGVTTFIDKEILLHNKKVFGCEGMLQADNKCLLYLLLVAENVCIEEVLCRMLVVTYWLQIVQDM